MPPLIRCYRNHAATLSRVGVLCDQCIDEDVQAMKDANKFDFTLRFVSAVLLVALTLLALFAVGCGGTLNVAEKIVWDVYDVKTCASPKVDYEVPSGGCAHGWESGGRCFKGDERGDKENAEVLFAMNGAQLLHTTEFAHELCHAAIVCKGQEDGDPQHLRAEWSTALPAANKKLEESGK